jgi:NAD(P)H dehydrogenase (quinone)
LPSPREGHNLIQQGRVKLTRVLVLYHSAHGHIETTAYAVAEGAKAAGAVVDVKRVPETVPAEIAKASHFKLDQPAPVATPNELANYDAVIVGAPTRFGRMPSALGSFWEQAGALWSNGALHGKVGGAFTSTGPQHGGNETTLFSLIVNLMHFGMTIVGLPYSHSGQTTLDEIVGGSLYGATTIAGGKGERQPTKIELEGARHQGELIAKAAAKLPPEAEAPATSFISKLARGSRTNSSPENVTFMGWRPTPTIQDLESTCRNRRAAQGNDGRFGEPRDPRSNTLSRREAKSREWDRELSKRRPGHRICRIVVRCALRRRMRATAMQTAHAVLDGSRVFRFRPS